MLLLMFVALAGLESKGGSCSSLFVFFSSSTRFPTLLLVLCGIGFC
jgi:hypothetical protein